MEMNNESKFYFNNFLKDFGPKRLDSRQIAVFPNGERFSFSVSTKETSVECRQTYSDCDGFISYHYDSGKYYIKRIQNISSYPYSRTTRTGITAHSIKLPIYKVREFHATQINRPTTRQVLHEERSSGIMSGFTLSIRKLMGLFY